MSKQIAAQRLTVPDIMSRKGKQKLACLTAYTSPMAALLDELVDLILVGDSVGMVYHGMANTIGVTLEMMILHGQAVMRGASHALVVVDLPFGCYEKSPYAAYDAAVQVIQRTGCQAVKVEVNRKIARSIAFLVDRGIPVVSHVGLRPQAANLAGGFKVQGRLQKDREEILADAKAADDAGAFAIVIEGVESDLAEQITLSVKAPTIGIGASAKCDGQILVTEDMLGLFEWTPKFVRQYADLRSVVVEAVKAYTRDVREGRFPGESETYRLPAVP